MPKSKEERMADILSLCGENVSEYGRRMGISPQTAFSQFKRGTFDAVAIAEAFPEISSNWLLYGTGPMLEADLQADEQFALDTLGITAEEVARIKEQRNAPAHAYEAPVPDDTIPASISSVSEATATSSASSLDMITIPRAVLNALTQQLDVKDAQIEALLHKLSIQK